MPSRAYVAAFNFKGADQQKKVGQLSGGERNRVHLAKMLKSGANVLLLDEPTNDLDVDTLRALEEALDSFAGCAVVISHDRWFLDRIATHILAFEGDSHVEWFEGNYQDYEADRQAPPGPRGRPAAPDQVQAAAEGVIGVCWATAQPTGIATRRLGRGPTSLLFITEHDAFPLRNDLAAAAGEAGIVVGVALGLVLRLVA